MGYGATGWGTKNDISRLTITVANTKGDPISNAAVLFKRRKHNHNLESDTLYMHAGKEGNRFVFGGTDSVDAPYGGTLIISAPGYISQEYPANQLRQNLLIPIALGRRGDIFVPVFNLMFPLTASPSFLNLPLFLTTSPETRE
jgi:hypothetical protein